MLIEFAYKSDKGQIRQHNQDYIWADGEAGVFIVADGMGGLEAGEVASQLSATTVARLIMEGLGGGQNQLPPGEVEQLMLKALESSNQAVLAAAREEGQIRKMGTTIVVVLVQLPTVFICHAGDTRAYLVRKATLTQLTEDDSYVAELVAAGVISKDDIKGHPFEHVVTKAIGQNSPLEPTFSQLNVEADDWLLLCSDGLTNMVSEEVLLLELNDANGDPNYVVDALTEAANKAGGKDNISVIAIRILPEQA
jgi:protein phosphatase